MDEMLQMPDGGTQRETAASWYRRFQASDYVTLLHLPFAGTLLAFTVIGAAMAPAVLADRLVLAMVAVFLAHQSSHYLDETRGRPWNTKIPRRTLLRLGALFMVISLAIGVYLLVTVTPLLVLFFIPLIFFPVAYSLEPWNGLFHRPWSFGVSGGLVCLGSYFLQTGTVALAPLLMAVAIGIQCAFIIILYEKTKVEETRGLAWQTLKGIILIWLFVAMAMLLAGWIW